MKPRSPLKRFLIRWSCIFIGLYLFVVIAAKLSETFLVFRGAGESTWSVPSNPQFQEIALQSAEGNTMLCRWLPPSNHDNAPVVLYFNGNGGNISNCDYLADQLQTHLKCGVFLMDYPGYGKSSGSPSEAGCYANATAAIDWLVNERKIPAERIVLMGQSLGGGTAVEMATKYHVRALVLVSTYSSLPAAAKSRFPFLPTYWLMSNRFDSLSKIGTITAPVFIVHGTDDRTIPFSQGETLFQTANEPKQFLRLEGNGHTGCMTIEMMRTLDQFLNQNPNSKN